MFAVLCSVFWSGCQLPVIEGGEAGGSFLYQPAYCLDRELRGPAEPHTLRPGDILLFADDSLMWNTLFAIARTGPPHHAGVVVARPDGGLASAEAGFADTLYVRVVDLYPRLESYAREKGRLWVRRRRVPLTAGECDRLTAFCMAHQIPSSRNKSRARSVCSIVQTTASR